MSHLNPKAFTQHFYGFHVQAWVWMLEMSYNPLLQDDINMFADGSTEYRCGYKILESAQARPPGQFTRAAACGLVGQLHVAFSDVFVDMPELPSQGCIGALLGLPLSRMMALFPNPESLSWEPVLKNQISCDVLVWRSQAMGTALVWAFLLSRRIVSQDVFERQVCLS